jgi:hypothetical protein
MVVCAELFAIVLAISAAYVAVLALASESHWPNNLLRCCQSPLWSRWKALYTFKKSDTLLGLIERARE